MEQDSLFSPCLLRLRSVLTALGGKSGEKKNNGEMNKDEKRTFCVVFPYLLKLTEMFFPPFNCLCLFFFFLSLDGARNFFFSLF